ncbi:SgcJ/EcaC family oxidoreductase [Nocardiopsis sp. NPDC050513]|uniref:SgcJ/EcaC family oxidoreductase n=1 Tax=Nocardiopsis sp. NPDC050513 TaxID=3364338 RepID=UPI0037B14574
MNDTHDQDLRPETEAIAAVVAEVERAQREEDVDAFVALFREDAIWTTAHGRRLFGRQEIAEFTRKVLPGAMRDLLPRYEVEHVQFIRPDVAAVKVRQRYLTRDGDPAPDEPEGTPLYVMSEEDGRWTLTAAQNTQVHA